MPSTDGDAGAVVGDLIHCPGGRALPTSPDLVGAELVIHVMRLPY
jgi:hypothetical protein